MEYAKLYSYARRFAKLAAEEPSRLEPVLYEALEQSEGEELAPWDDERLHPFDPHEAGDQMIPQKEALDLAYKRGWEQDEFFDALGLRDDYSARELAELFDADRWLDANDAKTHKKEEWEDSGSPYYDSAEGLKITKHRALHELKRHSLGDEVSVAEFLAEMGDKDAYDAQEVLRWLGY